MKSITEFSDKTTSKYELLCHLNDKILAREITTFSALWEYIHHIPAAYPAYKVETILQPAFDLIKELNWGFFKNLSLSSHTKLWREMVIAHERFKDFGDLKRNISISNLYLAMLDIHGYTRFCQESRGNLSQLHMLDDFITNGIPRITQSCGVLTQRERGDEIILIGTNASDIIRASLTLFNSFSAKPVIKDPSIGHDRSGYSVVLPDFKISAGIAGGNISTPLVVTEQGMLSGFLLNTAARLQTRANELNPQESKLVVTQPVYLNFVKENSIVASRLASSRAIYFYDNGTMAFKGVSLTFYEVLFLEADRYKEKLTPELTELFEAIKSNQWQKNIFVAILKCISKAANVMPPFEAPVQFNGTRDIYTPTKMFDLCDRATTLYVHEEDYLEAMRVFGHIISAAEAIPGFDRMIIDYAKDIHAKYSYAAELFTKNITAEIDRKIDLIFPENHKKAYVATKKSVEMHDKLKRYAIKSDALKRKTIWYDSLERNKTEMNARIYFGKK